jgi:DnaJ-class molecular chaperone
MEIGIYEILIILAVIYYALLIERIIAKKRRGYPAESSEKGGKRKEQEAVSAEDPHQDPYEILHVEKSATRDELALAYRKIVKMYHPDRIAGLAPEYREIAEQKMKLINAAYRSAKENLKQKTGDS